MRRFCPPPYFGHTFRTTRLSRMAIPMATAAKQHGKFLTTKLGSPITSPALCCDHFPRSLVLGSDGREDTACCNVH